MMNIYMKGNDVEESMRKKNIYKMVKYDKE